MLKAPKPITGNKTAKIINKIWKKAPKTYYCITHAQELPFPLDKDRSTFHLLLATSAKLGSAMRAT
jgi:hypothetical protein